MRATTETDPLLGEDRNSSHDVDRDHEYVVGGKLLLTVTSLTLAVFLVMLDMSIIATVSLFVFLCACMHC